MFNDEHPSAAFKKMHEFSTVDGFAEISESLAEMIKFMANEPSVGLYYVQQHTQNAVPNLVNLKNNVVEKSRETSLHAEDLEDSITVVRSMKECGSLIAEDMIRDMKRSIAIMSTKEPKRGLVHGSTSSGFRMGSSSSSSTVSWAPTTWGRNSLFPAIDDESAGYYLPSVTSVFKSAKDRANSFKWPQLDAGKEETEAKSGEERGSRNNQPPLHVAATSAVTDKPAEEVDELPLSSQITDERRHPELAAEGGQPEDPLLPLPEHFDEFKAEREAKLEEWLRGTDSVV